MVIMLAVFAYVSGDMRLVTEGILTVVGFALAGVCLGLALLVMRNTWYIVKNRDVYERNRRAMLLLRTAQKKPLTPKETSELWRLKENRILTHNSYGQLRLSDQAVYELYQ